MKNFDYRHIIIACILFITVPIAVKLTYNPSKIKDPVITINKKKISKGELNKRLSEQFYNKDVDSLVNSIVVKELMIQKAVESGIHKDKDFQRSIKNFYEQSLIKLLLDKKYAELKPEIDEAQINRYIDLSDKIVHLKISTYKDKNALSSNHVLDQQKTTMPFNDLSLFLKYTITKLKTGESSEPVYSEAGTEVTHKHFTVFTLDSVSPDKDNPEKETDSALIRELLQEQGKESLISSWIEKLRGEAEVSLAPSLTDTTQLPGS